MWIGSFSKISGCRNTGYGSILLPGETRTLFWQTALIPASPSTLPLILKGQGTKVGQKSDPNQFDLEVEVELSGEVDEKIGKFASRSSSCGAPLLIRAPRNLAFSLSTLFPVSTEDKPTQKIFALETFTALGKMSFVLPLSNSVAGRNSFCSYTPACPGSSIYPTLCECLSYKSDIISIDLNDGLCPTSHFKGVVSLSPAENLCGRSWWRGYRGVGGVE